MLWVAIQCTVIAGYLAYSCYVTYDKIKRYKDAIDKVNFDYMDL